MFQSSALAGSFLPLAPPQAEHRPDCGLLSHSGEESYDDKDGDLLQERCGFGRQAELDPNQRLLEVRVEQLLQPEL